MQRTNIISDLMKEGAERASKAFSKLINKEVKIVLFNTAIKDLKSFKPKFGSEELVTGIYLPIEGELKGAILLIFKKEEGLNLAKFLGEKITSTPSSAEFSALDISVLKEVGNILAGNYLTVLSNASKINVNAAIPRFNYDVISAVLKDIQEGYTGNLKLESALGVKFLSAIGLAAVEGYLLTLFEKESVEVLNGALVESKS